MAHFLKFFLLALTQSSLVSTLFQNTQFRPRDRLHSFKFLSPFPNPFSFRVENYFESCSTQNKISTQLQIYPKPCDLFGFWLRLWWSAYTLAKINATTHFLSCFSRAQFYFIFLKTNFTNYFDISSLFLCWFLQNPCKNFFLLLFLMCFTNQNNLCLVFWLFFNEVLILSSFQCFICFLSAKLSAIIFRTTVLAVNSILSSISLNSITQG